MNDKKIRAALIHSFAFALIACSSSIPQTSKVLNNEKRLDYFADLDKEYSFQTQALTESYLRKKLNKWLTVPVQGDKLVKEIAYARYKYPLLFCSLMLEDNDLFTVINNDPAVSGRKANDNNFKNFLEGCVPVPETFIGEFQVNTYTSDYESQPAVAMNAAGDFVIVWFSPGSQDGSGSGVFAQRYNSRGVPQHCSPEARQCNPETGEFRANTYTTGSQYIAKAAIDDAGNFVIAWEGTGPGDTDGIHAQRFNSLGAPLKPPVCEEPSCNTETGEFLVNSSTAGSQSWVGVAMAGTGEFVITWQGSGPGDSNGIFAQRFDSLGEPQGEFPVNTTTDQNQQRPSVDMNDTGNFVIAWEGTGPGDTDGIYAQRFNSLGTPIKPPVCEEPSCNTETGEFLVNTQTTGFQFWPSAAIDDAGDFVVTWASYDPREPNGNIYAQRYNSTGGALDSEFQVNTFNTSDQTYPTAAMDAGGDFVITWASGYPYHSQDGDGYGVYAQRYDSSGAWLKPPVCESPNCNPETGEFLVNTFTTSKQSLPWAAMDENGNFVITYVSDIKDGYGFGIFAQRYGSNGAAK
jgi:hypothetical protein